VVDDERHGLVHGGDGGHQERRDRDGGAGRGQRPEHARIDGLDPVERGGDVGEQDDRVVVPVVGRDPAGPGLVVLGPLGEDRRLSVAGRRDDRDDRRAAVGDEPAEQRGIS
jgi:hypothetical protein